VDLATRTKTWVSGPPSRSPGRDVLRWLYVDEELNYPDIGRIYGVTATCVMRWMRRAGIESRSTSEATRIGMSKPEVREKCSVSKRGDRHPNWCGGTSTKRLRSTWWKRIRVLALERDEYSCVECGRSDCRLNVHHIVPHRHGGLDDLENLESLCCSCHMAKDRHILDEERRLALSTKE
jgi:5-methylcytosine-specific restriction endonuclease McrA